jgi:CubicO group peptidase (beta-lactamase class C family)
MMCVVAQARSQDQPDRFKEQFEPVINQVMQQAKIPGYAIAVVENQKVLYAAGFGVRMLGEKEPVTARSLFHMASITKPFVATSIMQLWELGKIDLDAPVVKYLPYFRLKDERYRQVTVRMMLSHISGMPDTNDYEWDKPQYDDGALERYVKSLSNSSLIADPGTKFQYSNIAFEVLGDVIAKVSGLSFEDYVKRNILEPLGMNSSTLLVKQADAGLLTRPYTGTWCDVEEQGIPIQSDALAQLDAHSSVLDMSCGHGQSHRGELDGKRILKSSTYDLGSRQASSLGRSEYPGS